MVVAKSLEDLLLLNKMNEQANPTFSAFQSLANGISVGMEEKREMKKQEQAAQQKQQQALDFIDKVNNSQKGKLDENILSWSMDADGTMKASMRNLTESERKIRSEMELEKSFRRDVSSGMNSIELAKKYPQLSQDVKQLEELGVISPNIRENEPLTISENGGINKPSKIISGSPVGGIIGDSYVINRTAQGRPKEIISKSGEIIKGDITSINKAREEQTTQAVKSIENFNRVKQAISGVVGASKRMVQEQGGFDLFSVTKGKVIRSLAKTGLMGKVQPADAQAGAVELDNQIREVVLALSPILTGQNRVMESVMEMIKETMPKSGEATTGTEFTSQIKQTAKNAFRLSKALSFNILSPEQISSLNNDSPETIRKTMKEVLRKTSWTAEDEKFFEEQWEEIKNTKATIPESIFGEEIPLQIYEVK